VPPALVSNGDPSVMFAFHVGQRLIWLFACSSLQAARYTQRTGSICPKARRLIWRRSTYYGRSGSDKRLARCGALGRLAISFMLAPLRYRNVLLLPLEFGEQVK